MGKKLIPWLLIMPLLIIIGVFIAGLISSIIQGFGIIPAYSLTTPTLHYYHSAITDPNLVDNIRISLYVAVISSVTATALAVVISHCLVTLKMTGGMLYQIIKIPMFLPWMVTGTLIIHLFSGSGWLARVFYFIRFLPAVKLMEQVLYQPNHIGVIVAFVWASTPFITFFIVTVMNNLSMTFGEAAQNLGAGMWKSFFYITLPLCRPTIRNIFIIVLMACFGSYEIPALLGMTIPRALPVEVYYQYNHYDLQHRPYAMALNTIMLLISLLLAGTGYLLFYKKDKKCKKEHAL